MKTLSLCLVFLSSALVVNAAAQEQEKVSISAADKAVIREWLAHAKPDLATIQGDRLIISFDDHDTYCAFMRTDRVKREDRGSDVTRPSGYTTCVPVSRFAVKRSVLAPSKVPPSE